MTRSKIGSVCHFIHPESGEIIEGIYKRGRRVRVLESFSLKSRTQDGTTYEALERWYTLPSSVRIVMGPKPRKEQP